MKILVIDDEPKSAEHLARGLEESGYQVDTAHDGRVGLQAARESDYALVISDIMMPGFDGFSMVHELRRVGRRTPVLFVTARHDVEARVRGLDLGADDYLIKPFAFGASRPRTSGLTQNCGPPQFALRSRRSYARHSIATRHAWQASHRPQPEGICTPPVLS